MTFTSKDIQLIVQRRLNTNSTILKWNLDFITEKMGLLGDHAILKIQTPEQELEFFVKFFPTNHDQQQWANATHAFDREIFVCETFLSEFKDCTPAFYFAHPKQVVVYENLTEKGFLPLPKRHTIDLDVVRVVLKTLAKFHGSSVIYEQKRSNNLGKKYRINDEFAQQLQNYFYTGDVSSLTYRGLKASIRGVLNLVDFFQPNITPELKMKIERVCNNITNVIKPSMKYRNVLSHGDLWTTNLMVQYKDGVVIDCRLIDFQTARYSPPSHDVLAFLHQTTTRQFRKEHLNNLLSFYYQQLEDYVQMAGYQLEDLTYEQFIESCGEQQNFATVQTATYFQYTNLSNEQLAALFNDKEYAEKVFYEDSSIIAFRYVENDDFYRTRLQEAFEDLLDYCKLV